MGTQVSIEGRVSSNDTGKCMVDGNSALMCISISHKSSTGGKYGDNILVVAVSM